MVKHAPRATMECCPHVEQNDQRCGHRFSLGRIEQAFSVCFGQYHGCPMYHRLNHEGTISQRNREAAATCDDQRLPFITITTDGCELALRPTGS